MTIIVNGKSFTIDAESGTVTYTEIVTLAGYSPHRLLTITYRWTGEGDLSRSGTLTPNQHYVTPAEGMIFTVARTG